ncbi:MAG: hisJ [Peptococcaceae bacterium]|jgi:histidinol-phosphatase (PHP family)|nr:hisJ [Peptococcaceae bacterium]
MLHQAIKFSEDGRKGVGVLLVDYHVHALGHLTSRHTVENLEAYLRQAKARGVQEVGFAEHDRYLSDGYYDFPNLEKARSLVEGVSVRIGLECDYFPNKLEEIKKKISAYPFDFVIGSIHYIDNWMFDHPDYIEDFKKWDMDELYEAYYRLLAESAKSGFFDIIGHPDLIKIYGHRPKTNVVYLAEPALKAIKEADVVVEINTNGWHKPVGEVYPSKELLAAFCACGIPITLSSDAHQADQVGRDLDKAKKIAYEVGYRELATFKGRKRLMVEL